MAQINISESTGRALYYNYFKIEKDFYVIDLEKDSIQELISNLKKSGISGFVIKPDYIISKRGKNNLIGINLSLKEVEKFLIENNGRVFNGTSLFRYIILPYIKHSDEYYISITTEELTDKVTFSVAGGVDIEDNWLKTKSIDISVLDDHIKNLDGLFSEHESIQYKNELKKYISSLIHYFRLYGFAFLEINPFIIKNGKFIPLDFKGRLDDCAFFGLQKHIDIYSLIESSPEKKYEEERHIKKLDSMSGASLKLKIINKNGKIWPMVSGGGASIVYFDSLVELGFDIKDIAFYGEYSGNPSFEITYEYAKTIIDMMLKSNANKKVLLIAGANANFSDIAVTFKGIEKAIEENISEMKKQCIKILVRRGGPNVHEAFDNLKRFSSNYELDIKMEWIEHPLPYILKEISR